MARSVRAAIPGSWQFWSCCAIVCRDGLPCGRPAALWPGGWARRRCLSHGGRDVRYPAGRNPWALARLAGPNGPRPRLRDHRREREREKDRVRRREQRAARREARASARELGAAY